ncbi:YncE family protein [Flavitalea sp. BT771]|uniref:YncE family protein n=1 Tax=Flavitalea sp. BT771 TaxID=3063329 RepID=UPI0026E2EE74|nr:YncE family protein [Flavitalea sp. BT771]MDO6432694.1 YncE family protein [Flavitalea sp. BT771]MDV6222030.1 YncE family protein [Flavitalea sp. BT771]
MAVIPILLVLLSCNNRPDTTHLEKDILRLETKIPLPGVKGRIDHLAYDPAGHRGFIAALGNNTVEVVDLAGKTRAHTIPGLHEPQGVLYIPALQRLVVANGADGSCVFYNGQNYTEGGRVTLGDDADNVRYGGGRLYVGYGSGAIATIDPGQMKKMEDLLLKGHPESFQLTGAGRLFVNVPEAGMVVAAEMGTMKVTDTWKNSGASANFPMALDEEGNRLFIGYRHPAQVRVLDTRTGKLLQSLPCVGDADDLFYSAKDSLLFVSGGEGFVDVFRNNVLINHIATRKGARTSLWLPDQRQLLLAVPASGKDEAALWIYTLGIPTK